MPKFNVTRSIQINAPQQKIFDTVADFGTWTTWSPWLLTEPDATVTVSENSNSVGSGYSWDGEVVGAGELEHLKLIGNERIEDEIRFLKPWKSRSDVTFDLKQTSDGTELSWGMAGSLPWFMFWMKPMMETFIGMDYDRGLKMLKEWIETGSISSKVDVRGVESVGPIRMAGVGNTCSVEQIGPDMERTMGKAKEVLAQNDLPAEQGIAVYKKFSMKKGLFTYIAGYVIPEFAPAQIGDLEMWALPTVNAFRVDHIGCYSHLGNGWNAANQITRYKKMKQSKVGAFELYRRGPNETDNPAEYETEIYLPLK